MKKFSLFLAVNFIYTTCISQYANSLKISMKDTLNNAKECVVKIDVSQSSGKSFRFPENCSIGLGSNPNDDLIIHIEKLDSGGKYHEYFCKGNGVHYDGIDITRVIYKTYKKLSLIDSLIGFYCLEAGKYKLRVLYNKRKTNGEISFPKILAKSNWANFYVDKALLLNRYWLEKAN